MTDSNGSDGWPNISLPAVLMEIQRSIGSLIAAQTAHTASSRERIDRLTHHMDTQVDHLRQDMRDRLDRTHHRIEIVESRVDELSRFHKPEPWWKAMKPQEAIAWLAIGMIALQAAHNPQDAAETVRRLAGGL